MADNLDFTVNSLPLNVTVEETNINITPSDVTMQVALANNINLQVSPNAPNLQLSPVVNNINIAPSDITLKIAEGISLVGGNLGELQYNDGAYFGGVPNVTWLNGNLTLTNIANLKIPGGNNGQFLQTDGLGNLNFSTISGGNGGNASPGGANTQIQFNDSGVFGGNNLFTFNKVTGNVQMPTNLTLLNGNLYAPRVVANTVSANTANVSGNINGNYIVANVIQACATMTTQNMLITNNLQISTGNLTNSAVSITGPVTINTNIGIPPFYVNSSAMVSNLTSQFSFNANTAQSAGTANTANVANSAPAGNLTGNTLASGVTKSSLTLFGQVTQLTMAGTILPNTDTFYSVGGSGLRFGNMYSMNFRGGNFIGNGSQLTNLNAANLTGSVPNANYAAYAGNVTTAAQPNITSVGNLTSLTVTGAATVNGNLTIGGANVSAPNAVVSATRFISTVGNGTQPITVSSTTQVGNLNASYLEGYVTAVGTQPNTIVLRDAGSNIEANNIIGTIRTANQPYITDLPGVNNISVFSNANVGNLNVAFNGFMGGSGVQIRGTLNSASANQPNITNVGVLTGLIVSNTSGYANILARDVRVGAGTANSTVSINANVVDIYGDTGVAINAVKGNTLFTNITNGNIQVDLQYYSTVICTSNATANFTLNFVSATGASLNNMLQTNECIGFRFGYQNGVGNTYYPNVIKIDGTNVTTRFTAAAGVSNAYNTFDFTIYKSASNTYTVLAERNNYI